MAALYTESPSGVGIDTTPLLEDHNVNAWVQHTIDIANRKQVQVKLKKSEIPVAVRYLVPLNNEPALGCPDPQPLVDDRVSGDVMSCLIHPNLDASDI